MASESWSLKVVKFTLLKLFLSVYEARYFFYVVIYLPFEM